VTFPNVIASVSGSCQKNLHLRNFRRSVDSPYELTKTIKKLGASIYLFVERSTKRGYSKPLYITNDPIGNIVRAED
jgi:hypothetical protein